MAGQTMGASKAYELKQLDADLGGKAVARCTKQTVVDYAQALSKRLSRAGIATRLSYLRSVFTTARDLWAVPAPVTAVDEALVVLRHHKIVGRPNERTRRQEPEVSRDRLAARHWQSCKGHREARL